MARNQVSENKVVLSTPVTPSRHKSAKRVTRPAVVELGAAASTAPASEPEVPVAPVAQAVTPAEPSHDAIARLAYSYWQDRGCQGGSQEADWLRAERELRSR